MIHPRLFKSIYYYFRLKSKKIDIASLPQLNSWKFPKINGNVNIGKYCHFHYIRSRSLIETAPSGNILIGNNCFLNDGLDIFSKHSISIGSHTLIGRDVTIYDTDFHQIEPKLEVQGGPISIGENVWIGSHVIILPGVTIGDNAVIGAGSIITKDIGSNQIFAGNPAKFIRNISVDDEAWVRT